jgi:hypothetical protein
MLSSGSIPTRRTVLAGGDAGTDQTVSEMSKCAMGIYGAKSPRVRELAISIINQAQVPNKDYRRMIVAIHQWILRNIRYVKDSIGQETVCTPEYTLQMRAGDCDCMATLEAGLLGSIGIDTQFVVIGMAPGGYSHVYLQAETEPGTWIPLDPIMPNHPAGWQVPNPVRKKIYAINDAEGLPMSGLGHLFSEPIGSPNRTYVGDGDNLHSFFEPGPNTIGRDVPNYVVQSAEDDGANDDSRLPGFIAFPQNAPAPEGMQGIGGFATLRTSRPTRIDAYANVRPLVASAEGADGLFGAPPVMSANRPLVEEVSSVGPRFRPLAWGSPTMSQRPPSRAASVAGLGDDAIVSQVVAAPAAVGGVVVKSAIVAAAVWFFLLRK